jgi:hypothetical protein
MTLLKQITAIYQSCFKPGILPAAIKAVKYPLTPIVPQIKRNNNRAVVPIDISLNGAFCKDKI